MIELARAGAKGRFWYRGEKEYWQLRFRPEMALGVLAACSPLSRIDRNLDMALRVLYGFPCPMMTVHRRNVERVLAGEEVRGTKVHAFYRALMGDPDAVVVDRRMCRAAGLDTENPTEKQYHLVAEQVRRIAGQLGWAPAETQAAIWSAVSSRGTSLPFRVLARRWHGQWLPGMGAER